MGDVHEPDRVLLLLAAFSRDDQALDWAAARGESAWGQIALASDRFPFEETAYYQPSMGAGLKKQFLAFEHLIDPGELASIKLLTNAWEAEYAAAFPADIPRPLNLDPGYITPAKLVLASTKDFAHRIYLGQGIFAEITLYYRRGAWTPHEWTFPDYRRVDYHAFFNRCRQYLRSRQA